MTEGEPWWRLAYDAASCAKCENPTGYTTYHADRPRIDEKEKSQHPNMTYPFLYTAVVMPNHEDVECRELSSTLIVSTYLHLSMSAVTVMRTRVSIMRPH